MEFLEKQQFGIQKHHFEGLSKYEEIWCFYWSYLLVFGSRSRSRPWPGHVPDPDTSPMRTLLSTVKCLLQKVGHRNRSPQTVHHTFSCIKFTPNVNIFNLNLHKMLKYKFMIWTSNRDAHYYYLKKSQKVKRTYFTFTFRRKMSMEVNRVEINSFECRNGVCKSQTQTEHFQSKRRNLQFLYI